MNDALFGISLFEVHHWVFLVSLARTNSSLYAGPY